MAKTRVLVINLGDFFSDFRKKCIIPIDDTFKTIADVEFYLKDKFQIEEAIYLESSDVWIPSFTKIDILNSLDEVRLRLVQRKSEIGTERTEERHEETETMKKKRKRKQSYEPESINELQSDNIEEDSHSENHVKKKKKKSWGKEQIDTRSYDVPSSLTVEEDGKIPKKKMKKDKCRSYESAEFEKVETSISNDTTTFLAEAPTQTPSVSSFITRDNPTISNNSTKESTNIQTASASSSFTRDNPTISSSLTEETTNIQTASASSSITLDNPAKSDDLTEDTTNKTKRKRIRKRKRKSDNKVELTDDVLEKAKRQAMSIINSRLNWQPYQQVAAKRTHIRFDDDEEEEEREEEKEEEEITEAASDEIPDTCAPSISREESGDFSFTNPPKSESQLSRASYKVPVYGRKPFSSNPSTSNVNRSSDEVAINSNPSTSNVIGSSDETAINTTSISSGKVESEPPKSRYKVPVYYRKPFSNHTAVIAGGVEKPPAAKTGSLGIGNKLYPTNNEDRLVIESGEKRIDECEDNVGFGKTDKDGKDVQKDVGINNDVDDDDDAVETNKKSSNFHEEHVQCAKNADEDVEKEEERGLNGMKVPDKDVEKERDLNGMKLPDKDVEKERNLNGMKLPDKDDEKEGNLNGMKLPDKDVEKEMNELKLNVDKDVEKEEDRNLKGMKLPDKEKSSDNENGNKERETDTGKYENGDNEGNRRNGDIRDNGENRDNVENEEKGGGKTDNGSNVRIEENGSNEKRIENGGNVKTDENGGNEGLNSKINYAPALAVLPIQSTEKLPKFIPLSKPKPSKVVTNTGPDFSVGDLISFQVLYINSCAMPVVTEEIIGKILSMKKKFQIEVVCGTVKLGAERTRFSNCEEDDLKIYPPGSLVELYITEMIGPKKVKNVISK